MEGGDSIVQTRRYKNLTKSNPESVTPIQILLHLQMGPGNPFFLLEDHRKRHNSLVRNAGSEIECFFFGQLVTGSTLLIGGLFSSLSQGKYR
jgi:hypothetical protein